jgi:1-acyl-sn-glycerol-3-phosphate acyltransferase
LWLTKVFLNIHVDVKGAENVPERPCVIVSNHQSTWETFFLSAYFEPLSQVLKRELLYVPFFGWAMAMLRPIAIDRDNPKAALKQVASKGDELLKDNVWVLIFPEGTRVPYGQIGKFSRSGSALAVNADLPVLPIAHNAGKFWPKADVRRRQRPTGHRRAQRAGTGLERAGTTGHGLPACRGHKGRSSGAMSICG